MPLEPIDPPAPPALDVPNPPPSAGSGSPWKPADAENRDRILDWWRMWFHRVFLPWVSSWTAFWVAQWEAVVAYVNDNAIPGHSWRVTDTPILSPGITLVEITPAEEDRPLLVGDLVSDTTENSNYGEIVEVVDDTHANVQFLGTLRGEPGPNSIPTDTAVAGFVADSASLTHNELLDTFGLTIPLSGAGIDPTGVADSTLAIQNLIDANPGRHLRLPAGVFKITSLTLSKGQHLSGVGQQDWRDRMTVFGNPAWLNNTNFNGTVIRSTLTAGTAITLVDTEVNSGGMSDFTLIGPGSGTSVGVQIGSGSWTVVNALIRSVKIGNFFIGMRTYLMNEGSAYDLMIRGCDTGLEMVAQTIQNAFYMLDVQICGDGLKISDASSVSNTFYSMIAQSNGRTGAIVAGTKNVFQSPYFENNTTRDLDVTGDANAFHDPFMNDASDSVRVQAGASYNVFSGFGGYGTVVAITNAGQANYFQGRMSGLTDTGTNTVVVDSEFLGTAFAAQASFASVVSGITPGDATTNFKFNIVGKRCFFELDFTVGSTTVMTGMPTFTMPVAPINAAGARPVNVHLFNSGDNWYGCRAMALVSGAAQLRVGLINTSTGAMEPFTATTPITWSAGDMIVVNGDFEIA